MDRTEMITLSDGVAVWTRTLGNGPQVVFVPGAVVDSDLERLARPERTIVFYDSRNRGRSGSVANAANTGFQQEVADLGEVQRTLGYGTATVLGWSYLAGVAFQHALSNPGRVERLILVSPIGPVTDPAISGSRSPDPAALAHLDQLEAAGLRDSDPEAWCRENRRAYLGAQMGDPDAILRMVSDPCAHENEWPDRVGIALAHVMIDLGHYDWRPQLVELQCPLLVIHGDHDSVSPDVVAEWSGASASRLEILLGVGRFPWLEAPDQFDVLIDQFLHDSPV